MDVLARAGYAPHLYSGHSFRSGGATWAHECGLSGEMIRLLGDWKSEAYFSYLRLSDELKIEAARALGLYQW